MTSAGAAGAIDRPSFELGLEGPELPLLAVAVHHGGDVREEVAALLELDERQRRQEEDPFSAIWCTVAPNRLVALRSRFEVDLNRPPERAVYLRPEDSWGLTVWQTSPPAAVVERSLHDYARFYAAAGEAIDTLLGHHERVLVLDLHSYNHRRRGPDAPADDPLASPALNVGTGSMDRARWGPVVDAFLTSARAAGMHEALDVRENVRFSGGHFCAWVHRSYGDRACALALEVKKTFMDEWTGRVDLARLFAWREVLRAGAGGAMTAMEQLP